MSRWKQSWLLFQASMALLAMSIMTLFCPEIVKEKSKEELAKFGLTPEKFKAWQQEQGL